MSEEKCSAEAKENERENESENESDVRCKIAEQYAFDGETYVYRDKTSNSTYKFDRAKNEWVLEGEGQGMEERLPAGGYGFEDDTHTYTDPSDGTVYIWDREKNAWFPKVDDEFMARYQMNYGFTSDRARSCAETTDVRPKGDETVAGAEAEEEDGERSGEESREAVGKRKGLQEPPSWFEVDEAHNTAIYVSGLPLDVTIEQLRELFAKCGLIARDEKGRDKIKLYKDSNGEPKGDALCTYIKVESVELALDILDGSQMRGKTLSVQRAKFQLKGAYDPALKPKRKKKDKERQRKMQEKLLDWRPDRMRGEPMKCERVVVIKNLFAPEDFDRDVQLLLEYQQDVRSECLKCGDVRRVVVYDRHPEGVAQVTFREPAEAQACVQLLNGRWFSQRKISAEIWDGKTKYKINETDAEIEARIAKWDEFLDDAEEEKERGGSARLARDTRGQDV